MRKRDKIITAACRTTEGIEWTTLKVTQEGAETIDQENLSLELPDLISPENIGALHLPENVVEHLKGEVTIALRASELLMRVMEFPSTDPEEITEMVEFQIDKVSPFPLDQLAVAHEILSQTDETSLVLMGASQREHIDFIGDIFENQGVRVHSIDARVLGWMQLMRTQNKLATSGCEILIIVDGIDFILVVMLEGNPIALRSLHAQLDDTTLIDELIHEIDYTLTMLDTELDLPAPTVIQFWTHGNNSKSLCSKLSDQCKINVLCHDLNDLPPLTEGMLQRALSQESRIELIPREWVEHQKRKKMLKKFSIISGSIIATWFLVVVLFFSAYKARDIQLHRTIADATAIAPAAKAAQGNKNKLIALTAYTDRSKSSIECLREITLILPAGDIELLSYNYKKEKGVTLRGTAHNDSIVYDFFETLTSSKLFNRLKDQSINTKKTKGVRRTVFSASLELVSKEEK